jgi:hypothetical protein
MSDKKVCFVVMGYGMKTDHASGRTLDLDATYHNIIKPAVEEAGLICKRADEVKHSGTIDVPMFQYLISADVVIADLSTYNANAFYELGVRHALKPHTTIVISEKEMNPPFDVNHTVIRKYEHLGVDIGYKEVVRFRSEIILLINEILSDPQTDSPVYTFLHGLRPPLIDDATTPSMTKVDDKDTLSGILHQALGYIDSNKFSEAITLLDEANRIDPNNPFIIQKLVLATYKREHPSRVESLFIALSILRQLSPVTSTDPETLGLAGAINKRLWEETGRNEYLNQSIEYYEKGYYIRNDYYNGINLAFLYNLRGKDSSHDEKIADYVIANRIRLKVVEECLRILENEEEFEQRDDKYWVYATLEEAYIGLNNLKNSDKYRHLAKELAVPDSWQRESTESQIRKLNLLLKSK